MIFLDHIYIDMFGRSRRRSIVGLVSSGVSGATLVEFSGFINGLVKDQGLGSPVDCRIGFSKPR